ncbi:hypothetical protein JIN85_02905 [Luteolibacter pohnpeiensis]|uniref:Uncharacterized protein n=1 Tax=Luteolibacter pohnpeiensis TaxID=454153 RepID=A0A934VTC5_9BACT|nr:hypothetical protein [Luteolibacter pohnpeiensis]MBK1881347.1 hypothetical protein [Luteolibacter pohnpeiensis]
MAQSRALATGVCVVSLAAGYISGGRQDNVTSSNEAKELEAAVPRGRGALTASTDAEAALLASLLKGRSPADLSTDELAKILESIATAHPNTEQLAWAKNKFTLQLLLPGLSFTQLQQLVESDLIPYWLDHDVMFAFGAKNPAAAIEWAQGQPSFVSVICGAATTDPVLAAEYYKQMLNEKSSNSIELYVISSEIATNLAKSGSGELLAFYDSLPTNARTGVLGDALLVIPESQLKDTLDGIFSRIESGSISLDQQFNANLRLIATRKPDQIKAWVDTLPPGTHRDSFDLILADGFSANGQVDQARAQLSRAIERYPGNEKQLLQHIQPDDFKLLSLFSESLPSEAKLTAADLQDRAISIMTTYSQSQPNGLMDLANALEDRTEQAELVSGALNDLLSKFSAGSTWKEENYDEYLQRIETRVRSMEFSEDDTSNILHTLDAFRESLQAP